MENLIDLEIAVIVTARANMERQLDDATAIAKAWAMEERCRGILVTRHDRHSFTVALSDAVPAAAGRAPRSRARTAGGPGIC
ncbi:hypothetical protein AB0323_20420 [Arthrobacter sp. NPDC080031]|uniref:hypothetical protein n=1 Tax=Arthrobacter sp. NPDC080031 TaxID=3155918 RepID=UPI00344BB678